MSISIDTSASGFFVWVDANLVVETDRPQDNDIIELLRYLKRRGLLTASIDVTIDGELQEEEVLSPASATPGEETAADPVFPPDAEESLREQELTHLDVAAADREGLTLSDKAAEYHDRMSRRKAAEYHDRMSRREDR